MPLQPGGQVRCLETKTGSMEQAGGLQRMTLRGHTAGVQKVLLTPGGIDVITGGATHAVLAPTECSNITTSR
jgi:hypothetical protein